MKRFLTIAAVLLFAAALFVAPAQARMEHYQLKVFKDVGYAPGPGLVGFIPITSGIQYLVLKAGADGHETNTVHATLYKMGGADTMSNPVNFDTFDAEGQIDFWLEAGSDTSCDIIVVDNNGGYTLYMDGVTPEIHTAVINERPNIEHHAQIWFSLNTEFIWSGVSTAAADAAHTSTGPFDTGVDLLVGSMISFVTVQMIVPCRDSADTDLGIGMAASAMAFRGGNPVTGTGGQETDAAQFVDLDYAADTNYGDVLYSKASWVGETTGDWCAVAVPYVLTVSDVSLNYSIDSGDGRKDDRSDTGWGFIHYFFTPTR